MKSGASSIPPVVTHLPTILIFLGVVATLIGIAAACVYFAHFSGGFETRAEAWGQFGDYIGGVLNPMFAFMAFIALMLTIYVQLFELQSSTRELRASAEALKQQNESFALQSFENTFFQMVRLHNDFVAAIDLQTKSKKTGLYRVTRGRDCFKAFYSRFNKQAQKAIRGDYHPLDHRESLSEAYSRFHHNNEPNIGHYFRNLYRIFKFLSESNVENKKRYSGALRAQLSTFELLLLFYNGASDVGGKFSKYIVEFELLENLAFDSLLDLSEDIKLYDPAAYGERVEEFRQKAERTGGMPRVVRGS